MNLNLFLYVYLHAHIFNLNNRKTNHCCFFFYKTHPGKPKKNGDKHSKEKEVQCNYQIE
jgi:hypothetical protein